jgi:aryl-alcohol dehydrogenase-like predicted oxidoreductase
METRNLGGSGLRVSAVGLGCNNFGVTSLNEIKKAIGNLGLSLRSLD